MKPLFIQGRSLTFQVVISVCLSIGLMTLDHRLEHLKIARIYLSALIYPIQYLVDLPVKASQWLSTSFSTRMQLLEENAQLKEHNLRLQVTLQKFEDLRHENERLRRLLGSSVKTGERVQVAEVLAVDLDPSSPRKISINKGRKQGVFEGQPLLDAQGVIGQVVHVGLVSSTVMLITDPDHALPVQVIRTGLRIVAAGMGAVNRLKLEYLPNTGINAGIKVGDLLVTSGRGDQFPPGYPVGTVVEVNPDIGQPYAQAQAEPKALLERNREVLLVWKDKLPARELQNTGQE
jgi:rod shape-determining protein MreC